MWWRQAFGDVLDLALPIVCAGCSRPGSGWCRACRAEVAAAWGGDPRPAQPSPVPADFPRTWAAAPYEGALRHALSAYKDDARRDLAAPLAELLGCSLREAVAARTSAAAEPTLGAAGPLVPGGAGTVWVVPVPTTSQARRRRGDAPLEALARRACAWLSTEVEWRFAGKALTVRRRLADQSHLTIRQRTANLAGAFEGIDVVAGAPVVVVDDVVTTGATLAEATRALRASGAATVTAACVAATTRRGGTRSGPGS